jgi:hypothetical protein
VASSPDDNEVPTTDTVRPVMALPNDAAVRPLWLPWTEPLMTAVVPPGVPSLPVGATGDFEPPHAAAMTLMTKAMVRVLSRCMGQPMSNWRASGLCSLNIEGL